MFNTTDRFIFTAVIVMAVLALAMCVLLPVILGATCTL